MTRRIKRVAIVGGGVAGVTAAWQLAQLARTGAEVEVQLFESSDRLGGIVETVHRDGFTIESGPDGWVSEKPWAHALAMELDLEGELLFSKDETRKTHILLDGKLETMPDGMRMMVPTDLDLVDRSQLFSPAAKLAFHQELDRAAELKRSTPAGDESVASFTRRHFGEEVLTRIAAPLLSGVLGGDVEELSVRAVMPQFVAMEREHGSLIAALRARSSRSSPPIFTTLRSGLGTLIDRLVAGIPRSWLRCHTEVSAVTRSGDGWSVCTNSVDENFDAVVLATPTHVSRDLLRPLDARAAELMQMGASSAIVVALAFRDAPNIHLPAGFGFLVPPSAKYELLACTFVDQKFPGRVPPDGRLLRAFFGGTKAEGLLEASDEQICSLANVELAAILGSLPPVAFSLIGRWPRSLPQYAVGHQERMAELQERLLCLPGLTLLGNSYRGVGLPDLIRDARAAAEAMVRL